MKNQLNLTQAEIELISLKREQEVLAAKEAELRIQTRIQKEIESAEKYIKDAERFDSLELNAAKNFFKSFSKDWSLVIDEKDETKQVINYDTVGRRTSEVIWSKTFKRKAAKIVKGDYIVRVKEHVVFTRWSHSSKGYKMQLSGPDVDYAYSSKYLAKASTIEGKVKECIEAIEYRNNATNKLEIAIAKVKGEYQAKYPKCKITEETHYFVDNKGRYRDGHPKLVIQFPNGTHAAVRVYPNGEISTLYVNMFALPTNQILDSLYSIK